MKKANNEGPDISAIISDLADNSPDMQAISNRYAKKKIANDQPNDSENYSCSLWDEFISCLNSPEEDPEAARTKLYAIDDDIVETLHQCSFGKPNVQVINSILRTFLVDNLPRLKELYRPRSTSLLDKYHNRERP